jgi:hypothetical protein
MELQLKIKGTVGKVLHWHSYKGDIIALVDPGNGALVNWKATDCRVFKVELFPENNQALKDLIKCLDGLAEGQDAFVLSKQSYSIIRDALVRRSTEDHRDLSERTRWTDRNRNLSKMG